MDIQDRFVVENKLSTKELQSLRGGFSLTGTFLNAISRAMNTVYKIGQGCGSSLRRIFSRKMCQVK